jgi:hypothetical protein
MTSAALAARDPRASDAARLLKATPDGIFLWPATPLVYRRGNGFFALEPREVNSHLGCFLGPAALDTPVQTVLDQACDLLRAGQVEAVQRRLDQLRLPFVTSNGRRDRQAAGLAITRNCRCVHDRRHALDRARHRKLRGAP